MLEIKNVTKIYKTEDLEQKALNNVSINFRECEFASILGPSGSGKTTLLNIIGGLDHYTTGDLIINNKSTKKYKDKDWDSYRNHRIGFVFQSYNLIPHQSVLSNVRLALTLSGISKKESIKRAKEALKMVGLEKHLNKKPNQMSGGQMQRVAIARALVNNPDILLADEPTGALDSETSIQIMDILKEIAKTKLVIMVTHNPDLANEYSNRIITLKDGKITSDTNPYDGKKKTMELLELKNKQKSEKKTKMKFTTAFGLSLSNLLIKKGRTILVAFAGSIGIIGIALILAVSTGFQNYVDSISEDTLSSYPLTITSESTDITSMLLSLTSGNGTSDGSNKVTEEQYITSMLTNIKANDLKSFKHYLEDNYKKVEDDISTVEYAYSIDPLIYTKDVTGKISKLNPNNLFTSIYGSSMLSSYSSMTSVYSQMMDDEDSLKEQYDVLAGTWPTKYNEMIIVLSEPNKISDLLVYSLGLKDPDELTEMVTSIMSGESVDINSTPLELTYDDLLNIELKLFNNSDLYKYNSKYDVYEDMSDDESYIINLYNSSESLKIVGIVTAKEGSSTSSLSPGVAYRSDLIDHIIDYAENSSVVQKQLSNPEVDIFSGNRFDDSKSNYDFSFEDLVSVDTEKLQSAFSINMDQSTLENMSKEYMTDISSIISTDTTNATLAFSKTYDELTNNLFTSLPNEFELNETQTIVDTYLNTDDVNNKLSTLEENYVIPSDTYKTTYSALLNGLLQTYASTYSMYNLANETNTTKVTYNEDIKNTVVTMYNENTAITETINTMGSVMTEAKMKKEVMTKVGELITNITSSIASSFNVDENSISSAFKLNFTEDELTRVVTALVSNEESTLSGNLISLGYQDKETPTYIAFYFNSFDSKEHFLKFIDSYNERVEKTGNEDKVINYSDTTGILMSSVKTIVNAVSYVLIAFVSISLVVSSIMIGIITYISVYERTKEIGILRSIGASKKNISTIFNAETFIIGLLSGLFGIGISYALIPIINTILHHYTGSIPLSAQLAMTSAIKLIILSVILTLVGGLIPARSASKKDPVIALRSE